MIDPNSFFLDKALESLAGAQSEAANRRFNNVANRCYYATFQAALYALAHAGIQPQGAQWSHEAVPAAFASQLITRRKLYSADLRDVLDRLHQLRLKADYRRDVVTEREARQALQRAQAFLAQVQTRGGERR
jgi:uncharacterized protein (UPF0332 family)